MNYLYGLLEEDQPKNALTGLLGNESLRKLAREMTHTYSGPANTPSPLLADTMDHLRATLGNMEAGLRNQHYRAMIMAAEASPELARRYGIKPSMRESSQAAQDFFSSQPFSPESLQSLGTPLAGVLAYHGSPHKFNKFRMDKIGTGEGAQAYGHGLYFAESPGVAKSYRDNLSKKIAAHFDIGGERINAAKLSSVADSSPWGVKQFMQNNDVLSSLKNGKRDKFSKLLEDRISYLDERVNDWGTRASEYRKNPPLSSTYNADELEKMASSARSESEQLNAFANSLNFNRARSSGNLYKVDIADDAVKNFLDWDKPLSQQPESVRKALEKAYKARGRSTKGWEEFSGSELYDGLRVDSAAGSSSGVSDELRKLGIPGIRYLDQGSRQGGKGTSNFVVFDEDLVKILERNGESLTGKAGIRGGGSGKVGGMKYPLAPAGQRYEEITKPIKNMSPDEFLSKGRKLDIDDVARDNIEYLKDMMQSGKELDPLHIYGNGKIDGRHRAIAAKELGIREVPVVIH